MNNQPVNCPYCDICPIDSKFARVNEFRKYTNYLTSVRHVTCPNSCCDLSFYDFHIDVWNELFKPKEIDWEKEREKFEKWFFIKPYHKGTRPSESDWIWYGWTAALESRDE